MSKRVAIIGTGYVGSVTAACFASLGNSVVCVDSDAKKVEQWNSGSLPISEPGLAELVFAHRNKNLFFTTDFAFAVKNSDIVFVCVNTPLKTSGLSQGSFELKYVEGVARQIARAADHEIIVVEKSTVPLGNASRIREILFYNLNHGVKAHIVSNPEFLAEGTAVTDFLHPSRVLVGVEDGDDFAKKVMSELYSFAPNEKVIFTNIWSGELSKLASNAFLASRISMINAFAGLCEQTGADILEVSKVVGMDERIGSKFLNAGIGFGGSCFHKDLSALVYLLRQRHLEEEAQLFEAVLQINKKLRKKFVQKIFEHSGSPADKTICVLGFAFKPNTDDIRDAPAVSICELLLEEGARLQVYDSLAGSKALSVLNGSVKVCSSPYEAVEGADVLALLTEWDEFKSLDFDRVFSLMRKPAWVFDGRNALDHSLLAKKGFNVVPVGRVAFSLAENTISRRID